MKKILVITGPTGAGKTKISVMIAKLINGEIISCDSMQIYKHMNIGTAKVSTEEMDGVIHHMINVVLPNESFSVYDFKVQAEKIIDDILKRNKVPILVGGTGLYISSIVKNFSLQEENKDIEKRNELIKKTQIDGGKLLFEQLLKLDSNAANNIHPNNIPRIIRALEKIENGTNNNVNQLKYDAKIVILNMDRETLYDRINKRVDIMFELGLEKEVDNLIKSGVSFSNQSMKAIGYKEFEPYYNEEVTLDEVRNKIKQNTRNYAKRQLTYFKHQFSGLYLDVFDENIVRSIVNFYNEK